MLELISTALALICDDETLLAALIVQGDIYAAAGTQKFLGVVSLSSPAANGCRSQRLVVIPDPLQVWNRRIVCCGKAETARVPGHSFEIF
jgi:hypothetical protein